MHSCRSFQSRGNLLLFWGRRQWRLGGSKDLPKGQSWSLNPSLHLHSLATSGMPVSPPSQPCRDTGWGPALHPVKHGMWISDKDFD